MRVARSIQAERGKRLEASATRLRYLLSASPAIVYTRVAAPPHPFTFISDDVHARLGHPPEAFLTSPEFWRRRIHTEDAQRGDDTILPSPRDLPGAHGVREYRLMHADGSYRWMHDAYRVLPGPLGEASEIVGCWVDITDRKRAEFLLERQTRRLERSNRELEEFAYGASHDLRAPLRAIDTLSAWLQKDLEGSLGPGTREELTLLRGRVRRMDRLLCDLLEYARVGRIDVMPQLVDVRELLQEVIDLSNIPVDIQVEIAEQMPCFETARLPLKRVLLNLIGNAIKHHDRAEGRVTVSARVAFDMYEFSVVDDGPGVAPEYRQRIFQMFQTLRPRDQVEGSGMGLALVRRIVEGANGNVWVDSAEPRGSAFRFTWPMQWGDGRTSFPPMDTNAPSDLPPAPPSPMPTGDARGGREGV